MGDDGFRAPIPRTRPCDPGRLRRGYPPADYPPITGACLPFAGDESRYSPMRTVRAFIGLGGNLSGTAAAMTAAAKELGLIGQVVRASSLYATAPRDLLDQPDFTNAVLELETDLEPPDLLVALKRIELTLGRDPYGLRFGPRLIDLDILAIDGRCVDDNELDLVIPHPRLAERRFALEPLAELDPGLRPWGGCEGRREGQTVAEMLPDVADQELELVRGPGWAD